MADRNPEDRFDATLRDALRPKSTEPGRHCAPPDILAAYYEGRLGPEDVSLWEAHFAECAACREQLAGLAQTEAPPAEPTRPESVRDPASAGTPRFVVPVALAAAAAIVVAVGWNLLPENGPSLPDPRSEQMARVPDPGPAEPQREARKSPEAPRRGTPAGPTPAMKAFADLEEQPTAPPALAPAPQPSVPPEPKPTAAPQPTVPPEPTLPPAPTVEPPPTVAPEPTARPEPTVAPQPTAPPAPTAVPTTRPTAPPSPEPTARPTPVPTAPPTPVPTVRPTPAPTARPATEPQRGETDRTVVASRAPGPEDATTTEAAPRPEATPQSRQEATSLRKAAPEPTPTHQPQAGARAGVARDQRTVLILTPQRDVLWKVVARDRILHSTNGGNSWKVQSARTDTELLAGSAPSVSVCWVVGRRGTILRTVDGGETWETIPSPARFDFVAVRAQGAREATVRTGSGRRFTTFDGGASWR